MYQKVNWLVNKDIEISFNYLIFLFLNINITGSRLRMVSGKWFMVMASNLTLLQCAENVLPKKANRFVQAAGRVTII